MKKDNQLRIPTDKDGFLKTSGQFKYNEPFRVVGVQVIDIFNKIVGSFWLEFVDKNDNPKLYKECSNLRQWTVRKEEISDQYCNLFRNIGVRFIPKDVVRFVIEPKSGGPQIVMR